MEEQKKAPRLSWGTSTKGECAILPGTWFLEPPGQKTGNLSLPQKRMDLPQLFPSTHKPRKIPQWILCFPALGMGTGEGACIEAGYISLCCPYGLRQIQYNWSIFSRSDFAPAFDPKKVLEKYVQKQEKRSYFAPETDLLQLVFLPSFMSHTGLKKRVTRKFCFQFPPLRRRAGSRSRVPA